MAGRMRRWGWVVAVVAAAAVAWGAALALSPSEDQLIEPARVGAREHFTAAELERGREFRRGQVALGLGALAAEVALLALLAARPPARLRALRRPLAGGAVAGAALAVATAAVALPFGAVARQRARDVGLSTQSWIGWAGDRLLSVAIAACFAAALAVVALALMRRLPRTWWLPGSGVVVAAAAAIVFAGPIVLDPLFNRFEPLPRGALRSDVLALARAADVRVGEVYVMDASRRTTGANAYVAGLGATKRVVLYDNLVRRFPHAEARVIVAHELGHQHFGDLRRGLLYVAIVAPFGLLAVAALTARLAPGRGGTPAALPALALAFVLVSTGISWISNGLARKVEARADAFALRATRDPAAAIAVQRRLVVRNVGDPDPPAPVTAVLATHPPALERIGMARAFGERAGQPRVAATASRACTSCGLFR
jgi:STE24 endopeptidase